MMSPKSLRYIAQGKGRGPDGSKRGETRENTSPNSLIATEGKAKQYNVAKVPRPRPCKHLPEGSLESYTRKDSGGIADDIVLLWGSQKRLTGLPKNRKSAYIV